MYYFSLILQILPLFPDVIHHTLTVDVFMFCINELQISLIFASTDGVMIRRLTLKRDTNKTAEDHISIT